MEKAIFKDISAELVAALEQAERSIYVAVAWFTAPPLLRALENRARAGVQVRVFLCENEENFNSPYALDFSQLTAAGGLIFPVSEELMHHKFCIIDEKTLINGSYNWTHSAESRNRENLMFTQNEALLKDFIAEFWELHRRYEKTTQLDAQLPTVHSSDLEALKREIRILEEELAQLQTEKQEAETILQRLERLVAQHLRPLIEKILKKQAEAAQQQAAQTEKHSDRKRAEKAQKEWENFQQQRSEEEETEEKEVPENNALNSKNSLKTLYKEIAKACHPDRVPPEQKDEATRIFQAVQEAYAAGDEETLRQIHEKLQQGIAFGYDLKKITEREKLFAIKQDLEAQKNALKQQLETLYAGKYGNVLRGTCTSEDFLAQQEEALKAQL